MGRSKQPVYEFDNFRLDDAERQLLRDGQRVPLPAKAFDLLLVLVENHGRLVEKERLYQRVWADQIVEESNLTVQMSAIRKALGERRNNPRYIATVAGHGYRFTGEVLSLSEETEIVMETQQISRIVIEREENDITAPDMDQAFKQSSPKQAQPPGAQLPAGSRTLLFNGRGITLRAGLLLLLVGGVAAVTFYRSEHRNRQSSEPHPVPTLTLRRFTTYGGVPFRVAISPDGQSLVYQQRINGKYSLWLGQIESNTSVLLNQQEGLRFDNLIFTPDGKSLYFNVTGANRSQAMLARMPVLGGVMTELIPLANPITFAPDGARMAFVRRDESTNETAIIISDASGQNQHLLVTRRPPESLLSDGLSWSPDGKSIAFSTDNVNGLEEIWSANVADGSISRISNRDWSHVYKVVWLPDGSGVLALARERVGERFRHIWLISRPDGEARQITNDLNTFLLDSLSVSMNGKLAILQGHFNCDLWLAPHGDANPARRILQGVAPRYEGVDGLAWTPAGRLLYTAYTGDSLVIWSINPDGSDLKQLTPGGANASDSYLCVTPDGRHVVFQSNRSGGIEIWRINADGSNLIQMTTGGNNSQPSLSPDGQTIIYKSALAGRTTLARIPIGGGEPTLITETSSQAFQISPDGTLIACAEPSSNRLLIIPFAGGPPVKSFPMPETAFRATRLHWTPDGKAVVYRGGASGLLQQSLDELVPRPLKGFEQMAIRNFAWSFDGKSLAYSSGPTTQEIILIERLP